MKILVICQHYWPEPYPLSDLCEELVRRGHQVDVITGVPNYPMGKTYAGYEKGKRRQEVHNGVNIIRTFTIPRRRNALFRLLNYYSYALSSTWKARTTPEAYDVVFTNQTSPVMMSKGAFAYAKKHGKRTVMYCMDLWPACLAAGGVAETSWIYRFFDLESRRLYNLADRILITSEMFRGYLTGKHGVESGKIEYLPQYALDAFGSLPDTPVDKKTIDLMFAGNVGAAQSLQTVVAAAEKLTDIPNLTIHIVGDGSELNRLKALAKERKLRNLVFYGRKPQEEMPNYYAMADAMLVTLTADPYISLTLPGKVQTYMAAGKPILGAASGETACVLEAAQCGFCAPPEDAEKLAETIRTFIRYPYKKQLGQNGRSYYEQHFARRKFMDHLEAELAANAKTAGQVMLSEETSVT